MTKTTNGVGSNQYKVRPRPAPSPVVNGHGDPPGLVDQIIVLHTPVIQATPASVIILDSEQTTTLQIAQRELDYLAMLLGEHGGWEPTDVHNDVLAILGQTMELDVRLVGYIEDVIAGADDFHQPGVPISLARKLDRCARRLGYSQAGALCPQHRGDIMVNSRL